MGEARRRRAAQGGTFKAVDDQLKGSGVDTGKLAFYDQPAFQALEKADPIALELYAAWVLGRPRDAAYDDHARATAPELSRIVEARLADARLRGACVNVAAMIARMLDNLGVWSFAVRGSLTVEAPSLPKAGRRYFPECELPDTPDSVPGHGWVVAPPYLVLDPTLRHQYWVDLHPDIASRLPAVVASQAAEIVEPRWFDVIGDDLLEANRIPKVDRTDDLIRWAKPDLARFKKMLPGRDVREGELSLRYIAGSVTVSEKPLDQLPPLDLGGKLHPREIWEDDVLPAFKGNARLPI